MMNSFWRWASDYFFWVPFVAAILAVGAGIIWFFGSLVPDGPPAWCVNIPKAYSVAKSAEYVEGIGCIVTDRNNEKVPYKAFKEKYGG